MALAKPCCLKSPSSGQAAAGESERVAAALRPGEMLLFLYSAKLGAQLTFGELGMKEWILIVVPIYSFPFLHSQLTKGTQARGMRRVGSCPAH